MAKQICIKCSKFFKGRRRLLCPDCEITEYNRLKRSAQKIKTKVKNNKMIKKIFKLQETETPAEEPTPSEEETPSEGTPTGEEKKEDEE